MVLHLVATRHTCQAASKLDSRLLPDRCARILRGLCVVGGRAEYESCNLNAELIETPHENPRIYRSDESP